MNKYSVYRHISPSGGVYIGMTGQQLKHRWQNGRGYYKQLFDNVIKKYGWDNIEHKVLYDNLTQLEAEMIEEDLIYYYKTYGYSYNVDNGGYVGKLSEETKIKISLANTGRIRSEETKKKISEARKGKYTGKDNGAAKSIIVTEIESGSEIRFDTVTQASIKYNIDVRSISKVITGVNKTFKNRQYIARYE